MRPIDLNSAQTVDILDAERILRGTNGKFFRVEFVKRTDGKFRRMVARIGVKPTNGNRKRSNRAADHGLVTVWEPGSASISIDGVTLYNRDSGYRSIPIEGILAFKAGGKTYRVKKSF